MAVDEKKAGRGERKRGECTETKNGGKRAYKEGSETSVRQK